MGEDSKAQVLLLRWVALTHITIGPKLLTTLVDLIHTFITRGEPRLRWPELQPLVRFGIARFVGDGPSAKVTVEEPLALVSIMRHFESNFYTLEDSVRTHLQTNQGTAFEEVLLLALTRLLQRQQPLSNLFQFPDEELPPWAQHKAQIVARNSSGEFHAFAIENPIQPATIFAFPAETPEEVTLWLQSGEAGWCLPGDFMGPDLMARLLLDNGKHLLLVIQAKCQSSGNNDTLRADVAADAIRSLTPANFFRSLVCNDLGILWDPSLTAVCL